MYQPLFLDLATYYCLVIGKLASSHMEGSHLFERSENEVPSCIVWELEQ